MATFRQVFFRWIFAATVFSIGGISLGAAFAPSIPAFREITVSVRLGLSMVPGSFMAPVKVRPRSPRSAALSRLNDLVLMHRALSISA